MDKLNELKYLLQLPLPKFRQVQAGYVCSCLSCKEGIATPWKTRMYFLTNKEHITVYCVRCGYNHSLKKFLEHFFPSIHEEYVKEEKLEWMKNLQEGTYKKKQKYVESEVNNIIDIQYKFNLNKKYFKPAKNYKLAVEFCKKRNIIEHIDSLYYNIHPKHPLSGMVVFPFYLEDQETLYALQGRHTERKEFYTHSKNDSMKVYNIYNVNLDEPIYIFESIIDSLMVPNSIAMLGTSLSKAIRDKMKSPIYVFDNDYVGMQRCLKYLENGEKCFIFPEDFKWKDFNDAVCKGGYKKEHFNRLLKENSFAGIMGVTKIKFQMMKRKK